MRKNSISQWAAAWLLALLPLLAFAQTTVISSGIETERHAVLPVPTNDPRFGEMVGVSDPDGSIAAATPGASTRVQEHQVTLLAFRIPDFDPASLRTHFYRVGHFGEGKSGFATLFPDDTGYADYELRQSPSQPPLQTFLFASHAVTGEVTLYLEFASLTVADAVTILNVATRDRQPRRLPAPPVPGSGSAAETNGDLRRLQLLGRFSLEELTAEIATQARCDVAVIEGQYRLARCD